MGNTHSSMGLTFGSALGGLLLAPFTGGASLVAVGVASGIGTAVGTTTFAINALNNHDAPEGLIFHIFGKSPFICFSTSENIREDEFSFNNIIFASIFIFYNNKILSLNIIFHKNYQFINICRQTITRTRLNNTF